MSNEECTINESTVLNFAPSSLSVKLEIPDEQVDNFGTPIRKNAM